MSGHSSPARMPLFLLATLMLIAQPLLAPAAEKAPRPRLTVPKLAKAPTIDGTMADGEWDRSAAVTGFMGATGSFGKVIVPKNARIYLGQDDENIYVAVWTQLAPGEKPTMRYRRRDDKVYMDRQQFEIWLTPPTRGHVTAYQMIGNAYGAMYDIKLVPALGVNQPGWNPEWQFKNAYKTGEWWTAEFAIAKAEMIDEDGYDPDLPWGGMVAVAWPQRSWPFTFGWYKNIETHALMTMGDDDTCVRLMNLNGLLENKLAAEMTLVNGGKEDGQFTVTAKAGEVTAEQTVTVPAGGRKEVSFSKDLPATDKKVNVMELNVVGPGKEVLLDGQWMYRPMDLAERKPEPVEAKPWSMDTRLAFAPLAMGAHAWADVLDAPMRDEIAKAVFIVKSGDGETILTEEDKSFEYDAAEVYLWMPKDLPFGEYTVEMAFVDDGGKELASASKTFKHKNYKKQFVWLDSDKYGEDIQVAPPFKPLKTDKAAKTVNVWGRTYTFDGALPEQIVSQGREMLAAPVQLVAVVGGKKQVAKVAKPLAITSADENRAMLTGRYTVAGLTIDLTGELLFDGGISYELSAKAGDGAANLDRLYLSIPVKRDLPMYMWGTRGGAASVHYLLEDLPDEDVVWSSRLDRDDFLAYLGLANDDIAIQWWADNDHEWVLGSDAPGWQIARDDDSFDIEVSFVQAKGKAKDFSATFGLIATPIKPMPAEWRDTILHFGNITDSKVAFFYGPGHGKVGPFDWHDSAALAKANGIAVPKGKSAAEVLDGMSGEGYPNLEAIKKAYPKDVGWVKQGLKTYEDPRAIKQCFFHNAQMYFEGHRAPGFKAFFPGDWTLQPPSGWFHLRPVESYQDFFCFHLTNFLKYWAVPGLYFDETYFAPDYNVFNGQGKVMPDGSIRPSVGLSLQRRFLNRARQCCLDAGKPAFLWVHTSNIMAPFAISAVDIAMFGEDNIPTPQKDIMDTIRPAYIRILGKTDKFGFVPMWMTMAGRGGAPWSLAGRQTFGWCWLHDAVPEVHTHRRAWPLVFYRRQWGIAEDDVTFHPYWKNEKYVKTDDEKFLVSFHGRDGEKGKKAILTVMNMHYREDGKTEVTLTLDPEAMGLADGWKVYNVESMPAFVQREKVLRGWDRATQYGAKPLPDEKKGELSMAEQKWEAGQPYKLEELDVLSDGKTTFKVTVPGRDFLTLIIE